MYTIGIDLGGTHIAVGVVDENNNIVKKISAPTLAQRGPTEITKDMAALSKRVCEEVGIDFFKDVQKIGIASPGTVNPSTGKIEYANNIKMIDYPVVKEFSEFSGVDEDKITIGNDANLAVYGEVVAGAAKGAETAVMITLGTGVGGGIILNEKIWTGEQGVGGEIGHIHIREGEKEACNSGGHGCLEQVASATGIAREARRKMAAKPDASVMRAYGDAITAKNVLDAAKAGDALALEVMDTVCYYLGWALATISMTVDPEIFVIGGGVSKAGTFLTDWIDRYYRELTPISENKGEVRLATLGNDAGIYGAARLILD